MTSKYNQANKSGSTYKKPPMPKQADEKSKTTLQESELPLNCQYSIRITEFLGFLFFSYIALTSTGDTLLDKAIIALAFFATCWTASEYDAALYRIYSKKQERK